MQLKWPGLRADLTGIVVVGIYSDGNRIFGSGICDEIDMNESE